MFGATALAAYAALPAQRARAETGFSAYAYPATGAPTSRTTPNVLADVVNVRDFGAIGDGVTPCGAALQAAFDAAYGPASNPNGNNSKANRGVIVPAGDYIVDRQLFINLAKGAFLQGAGQYATRFIYTGPNSQLPSVTALLTCESMSYSHVEGITFDVTGSNAPYGVVQTTFPAANSDGTATSWINCGFVGASLYGWICSVAGSGSLGSEQLMIAPRFENCMYGMVVFGGNALNYSVINPRVKNCIRGLHSPVGAINLVSGGAFDNPSYASFTGSISGTTLTVSGVTGAIQAGQAIINPNVSLGTYILSGSGTTWTVSVSQSVSAQAMVASALDIYVKEQNALVVTGCSSTSPNFCLAGPVEISNCRHNPSVAGGIWNGRIDNVDNAIVILDGNICAANSSVYGNPGHIVYSRGNTLSSPIGSPNFTGTIAENI